MVCTILTYIRNIMNSKVVVSAKVPICIGIFSLAIFFYKITQVLNLKIKWLKLPIILTEWQMTKNITVLNLKYILRKNEIVII